MDAVPTFPQRIWGRRFASLAIPLTLAFAGSSPAARVVVDGGYTATPTTLPPVYEDTGGTELIDGDVGTLVWPDVGTDVVPLTGWQDIDGTVTFNFTAPVNIGRIVAWFADSDGNAAVSVPESIRVTTTGGFDQLFPVTNPGGSGTTVGLELDGFDITTDNVTLDFARNSALDNPFCCGGAYQWMMISEVEFFTPSAADSPTLVGPAVVDLGRVANTSSAVAAQFDVSNVATTTADLNISGVSFSGADAGSFTTGTAPSTLTPGQSGQVTFTFDPSGAAPRVYSADLEIASDDPASPTVIPVSVEVVTPLTPSTPYQQAVVASDPLLYWTFDEAGDTDNARCMTNDVPENDLVPRGAATRVPSTVTGGGADLGRAAAFDGGLDTRFLAPDLSDTTLPVTEIAQFAVELWFKADDSSARYLLEADSEVGAISQPALTFGFGIEGLVDDFAITSGGATAVGLTDPAAWHHAVVAHYAAGDVEIYIDGVPSTPSGFSSALQAFGRLSVGAPSTINFGGFSPFSGLIDELAIYDLSGLADDTARRAHVASIAAHSSVADDPLGLRLTDISLEPGNRISITWASRPNVNYSIFWSSDLANFGADVDDFVPSQGTSTTHVFDNPSVDFENPEGLPNVFLRVSEN